MKKTNINFLTSNKIVLKAGLFSVLAFCSYKVPLYQVFGKITNVLNLKNLTT